MMNERSVGEQVRDWGGRAVVCAVLLVGATGMTYGERIFARAAGLPDRQQLLAMAALSGDAATVRRALAAGVSPDARTKGGMPALVGAAAAGDAALVRELLERGADPNVKFHRGWTPLDIAEMDGHADVVAALIAAGADPAMSYRSCGDAARPGDAR